MSLRAHIASQHSSTSQPRPLLTLLLASMFVLNGCGKFGTGLSSSESSTEIISSTFHVGQSVVGSGAEVAHIDIMIGHKDGPVGTAFVNALANQKEGFSNLLAVIGANTAVKPSTVLIPKVATQDAKHSKMLFGPAQLAVAKAVSDSLDKGLIPASKAEDWVIVCGVYVHWNARDEAKVYKYNYLAMRDALDKALRGKPGLEEINKFKANLSHPYMPADPADETQTAARIR